MRRGAAKKANEKTKHVHTDPTKKDAKEDGSTGQSVDPVHPIPFKNGGGKPDNSDDSIMKMEICPEILQQLSSDSTPIDLKTVIIVAAHLAKKYRQNFDKNVKVLESPEKFQDFLSSLENDATGSSTSNHFLLLLLDDCHWVSLSLVQNKSRILYKDPRGLAIENEGYLEALKNSFLKSTKIICHNSVEIPPTTPQHHESHPENQNLMDSGVICLKNLEIILAAMTTTKNREETFIKKFRATRFCPADQIKDVKQKFRDQIQSSWSSVLTNDLTELKKDGGKFQEFVKELNIFIETCQKYQKMSASTTNFVTTLREEMTKAKNSEDEGYWSNEDNFKKLDAAKKDMLNNEQIQQMIREQKEILKKSNNSSISSSSSSNDQNDPSNNLSSDRMSIEEKFPYHMKVFTTFFNLLFKCKADNKLKEGLEKVAKNFGIEYDKLKDFFEFEKEYLANQKAKEETEENGLTKEKNENDPLTTINGINLQEMWTRLESTKEKTKDGTPADDPTVKDIDQLLYEYICENLERKSGPSGGSPGPTLTLTFPSCDPKKLTQFYEINPTAKQLKAEYLTVKKNYDTIWSTKSGQEIQEWVTSTRKNGSLDHCMALAAMDRANQLVTPNHRLRDPQILSILIFLQSGLSQGKLCQIQTGEGKTTIVAMLAALKILAGEKFVDVITSNNVLAQESVNDKLHFFTLLGLTVSTNNNVETDKRPGSKLNPEKMNEKSCYSCDIVYGSIANFQFDYLRDLTDQNSRVRGQRSFGCLILDEVDSMIIDSGGHIAKLSVPLPGMDSLRFVYIKIWQALQAAETSYVQEVMDRVNKGQKNDGEAADEVGGPDMISFGMDMMLEAYDKIKSKVLASRPLEATIQMIPPHLHAFARSSLDRWIENAMFAKFSCQENEQYSLQKGDKNDGEVIVVPLDYANTGVTMKNTIWSHGLHQFVQLKHNLQLTAESLTSSCVSNYGYINFYGNKIFGLTGTLGSRPEQGLMARMYNVDFAQVPTFKEKKFKQLGGRVVRDAHWAISIALEAERQAVKDKRAILIISKTVADCLIVDEALKNLEKIGAKTNNNQSRGRQGRKNVEGFKIKKFLDETGAHILRKEVDCGDIIIATNIAGRGADFKTTPALEANGGLHVLTTFYPDNERVKEQAFFRTARQGNFGTARIIMRESEVKNLGIYTGHGLHVINFDEIKAKVETMEQNRINSLMETKVAQLYFQDYLFSLFAKLCRQLCPKAGQSGGFSTFFQKIGDLTTQGFTSQKQSDGLNSFVVEDLKEFWAFWLEKQNFEDDKMWLPQKNTEDNPDDDIIQSNEEGEGRQNFEQLESNLRAKAEKYFADFRTAAAEILAGQVSHNPYYCVQEADSLLENDQIEEAQRALERALFLSQKQNCANSSSTPIDTACGVDVMYAVHMKLFEIAVKKGGVLMNRFKDAVAKVFIFGYFVDFKDVEYKDKAIEHLRKAKESLIREINYMQNHFVDPNNNTEFSAILKQPPNQNNWQDAERNENIFLKYLESRLVCLNVFYQNAAQLLSQLEESGDSKKYGLYIGSRVPNYLKKLEGQNEEGLKKVIQEATLNDLGVVGLDTIYALQKVHDAPPEMIAAAQAQIAAGIATHATGICFPPLLPVTAPVAGALISEGILDIALELLVNFQGRSEFNGKAYLQGKLVSYGISLLTAGISAILSSSKILAKASKACQSLANLLRKCPMMKTLCNILANQLDKLARWLSAMAELAKAAGKLRQAQKLTSVAWTATKGAGKGVVASLVMEKVTTHVLDASLQNLKPTIRAQLKKTVAQTIDTNCLKSLDLTEVTELCTQILEGSVGEMLKKVAQDIGLGLLRHSNTWKVKVASLTIETCITGAKLWTYTEEFCDQLNQKMRALVKVKGKGQKKGDEEAEVKKLQDRVTDMVTDQVYSMIMALAGKYTNMFVVTPLLNKLYDALSPKKKEVNKQGQKPPEDDDDNKDEKKTQKNIKNGADKDGDQKEKESAEEKLRQKLNLPKNATDDDIQLAYCRTDEETATNVDKAKAGLEAAKNGGPVGTTRDLEILSQTIGQPIEIIDENGKRQTFGAGIGGGKPPIPVEFHKGQNGQPGHYTLVGKKEPPVVGANQESTANATAAGANKNDCLLNSIAAQLSGSNISPKEMRQALEKQYDQDLGQLAQDGRATEKLYAAYNENLIGGFPTPYLNKVEVETALNESEGQPGYEKGRKSRSKSTGHSKLRHCSPTSSPGDPPEGAGTVYTSYFKNTEEQNQVGSLILNDPYVSAQLNQQLNIDHEERSVIEIPASAISEPAPEISEVNTGENEPRTGPAQSYVMIVGHQRGKENDPNSRPHLTTLYPSFKQVSQTTVIPKRKVPQPPPAGTSKRP